MITLKKYRLVVLTLIFIAPFLNGCSKIERPEKHIDRPVAYVVNGESNSLSVLDLEMGEQNGVYEFRKGSWPHYIYPSSTSDRLLVSLTGADLSGGHAGHADADESWLMVLRSTRTSPTSLQTLFR